MALEVSSSVAGFWSYAHADDRAVDGQITRLAHSVRQAFALLTGQDLNLFVDRELAWGDEWRLRIDDALALTTFFIPVITPRYFQRPECRQELLAFAGQARSLGVEDLLLPIVFVDPHIAEEDADEAKALVAKTQYVNWTDLRLEEESSASYRRGVNDLAMRLAEIASAEEAESESDPHVAHGRALQGQGADVDAADDMPGMIEIFAKGEEVMDAWNHTLDDFTAAMDEVGEIVGRFEEQVLKAEQRHAPVAARVFAARELGKALAQPGERMREIGQRYASQLVDIDPAVLTYFRLIEEDPTSHDPDEVAGVARSIEGLAAASEEAMTEGVAVFLESLDAGAQFSSELRRPLGNMKHGVRAVLDGQALIEEWGRRAQRVRELVGRGDAVPREA